jgi:hypothetical protein
MQSFQGVPFCFFFKKMTSSIADMSKVDLLSTVFINWKPKPSDSRSSISDFLNLPIGTKISSSAPVASLVVKYDFDEVILTVRKYKNPEGNKQNFYWLSPFVTSQSYWAPPTDLRNLTAEGYPMTGAFCLYQKDLKSMEIGKVIKQSSTFCDYEEYNVLISRNDVAFVATLNIFDDLKAFHERLQKTGEFDRVCQMVMKTESE